MCHCQSGHRSDPSVQMLSYTLSHVLGEGWPWGPHRPLTHKSRKGEPCTVAGTSPSIFTDLSSEFCSGITVSFFFFPNLLFTSKQLQEWNDISSINNPFRRWTVWVAKTSLWSYNLNPIPFIVTSAPRESYRTMSCWEIYYHPSVFSSLESWKYLNTWVTKHDKLTMPLVLGKKRELHGGCPGVRVLKNMWECRATGGFLRWEEGRKALGGLQKNQDKVTRSWGWAGC